MDKSTNEKNLENVFLEKVIQAEGLIVAKTKIYSRLLTETALAEEMEKIALKREKSKSAWLEILTGEPQNNSQTAQGEQGQDQEQGEGE